MPEPKQKPGSSDQSVGTPPEFLRAVEGLFGKKLAFDLAADDDNTVVQATRQWRHYSENERGGSLSPLIDWANCPGATDESGNHDGILWLNPPFGNIKPFAEKASRTEYRNGQLLTMLVPASVSSNWHAEYVHDKALVLFVRPRLTFVGHEKTFPKDLMLACYGKGLEPGYHPWKWR